MDFVILALAAVAVAFFLPIFLLFRTHKMKAQINALERSVEILTGGAKEPETPVIGVEEDEKPVAAPHQPWEPPKETAKSAVRSEPVKKSPKPPKVFVFKPEYRKNIANWLQKNWFFAVAGVSLALAGVFLVQYGVENGLLSPTLRVISAIALGIILIAAGEYVRRKLGSDEDGSFALLPSVFSGAGLISMFAGVLSARMMYGLIGPEVAFIGLGLTGALAVVLGWFYGPLLAIVGVFGALAAPFLVGGDSDNTQFLQLYFAGIAAIALLIDTIKRWAWLSSLGLIAAFIASILLYLADGNEIYSPR